METSIKLERVAAAKQEEQEQEQQQQEQQQQQQEKERSRTNSRTGCCCVLSARTQSVVLVPYTHLDAPNSKVHDWLHARRASGG
jgi:hypothetical protein